MNRTCQVSKMNQNIIGLTISRNVRAVNDRPFSISAPINPLCSRFGYFDGVARCVEARRSSSVWRLSYQSMQLGRWPRQ